MKIPLRLAVAVALLATARILTLSAATLFVSLESTNPIPPFTNWETAATNIQQAVDAAKGADTVLATNGVYATGGRTVVGTMTNRVVVEKPLSLRSVSGPQFTVIQGHQVPDELGGWRGTGDGAIRCVFLAEGATLSGFTLTSGATRSSGDYEREASGGGAWCASTNVVLTNCVMVGNSAEAGGAAYRGTLHNCTLTDNSASYGGGAYGGTLYNCTLTGNSVVGRAANGGGAYNSALYKCTLSGISAVAGDIHLGGGAYESTLYNCTLTDNSAGGGGGMCICTLYNCTLTDNSANFGGGAYGGTLYNCIVYFNTADEGANYSGDCTLQYSCTTPLPTNGVGNITGPPLFMDVEAGDFRLREDSPCIDVGTNLVGFTMTTTNMGSGEVSVFAYSHDATDIVGNTRFIDGNGDGKVEWDIGAYEFNSFKPPRFSVFPQLTPDGWQLSVTGPPNKWARLQRSSNLKDWEGNWLEFRGAEQFIDSDTGQKAMFYRVVVP